MSLDLNKSWSDASGKVSAIKTVREVKENQNTLTKANSKSNKDKRFSETKRQVKEDIENKKQNIKNFKSETKNQLELLLDLYRESLPNTGSESLDLLSKYIIQAANETKSEIGNILIDEIISTLGCSEEQSYQTSVNQPFYIKVKQIDLFGILKNSTEDDNGKFFYESKPTANGQFPYSMNRQLYKRTQNPNLSFYLDPSGGNGQYYIGSSQSPLFDIEYVENYTDTTGGTVTGEFFKITLISQNNNRTKVSDFLRDYFTSIDIMSFDLLSANLKNYLTGAFSFGLGDTEDEMKDQSDFLLVMKRIMGICSDPTKRIDVAGTAKLSDLDNIDDSFFDVTEQESAISSDKANNIINGVIEFDDCETVKFPINIISAQSNQNEIVAELNDFKKTELLKKFLDEIANDPSWKSNNLNIKGSLDVSIITKLPLIVAQTVLSPKVLLGFFIMIKGLNNGLSITFDSSFDNLKTFMKTFKKFVLGFMGKLTAIFVEKLFLILKANLKKLVETILTEIMKETKIKQLRIYTTIVYATLVAAEGILDYRNCKSVIDEILKLINLGLESFTNIRIPPFILAGASNLSGISDIRSTANVIEILQKAGLPTGPAPDGGPNLMNIAISSIIQGQNKEMAENGKTEVFIPPLTVTPAGLTLPNVGSGKSF